MATMTAAEIHPWERAGLGFAPFSYLGCFEKVYSPCPGVPARAAGTCDACGTGIRYCFRVRSHDGNEFVVGCDCIQKVYSENNVLRTAAERDLAKIHRAQREAKREEKRAARNAAHQAKLAEEREQNGGLTNDEVKAARHRAELREAHTRFAVTNKWLIDVLTSLPYESIFAVSIAKDIETQKINALPARALCVLEEIYAKQVGGRRGSAAYNRALDEFNSKVRESA